MMVHFPRISLLLIFSLQQTHAQDFSATHEDVTALYKLEERLIPALDTFISEREDYLKELEDILNRTAVLRALSGNNLNDVGEYLGNPLNQFNVVKRFVDDWGTLEEYFNSEGSIDDLLTDIKKEQSQIPGKAELDKALGDMEKNGIDPESYRVLLS